MSRSARFIVFFAGAGCLGVMLLLAFFDMPTFGSSFHPYRDHAVGAATEHRTANVVSSVNFDQRALDTLGEETIFFGSVIGAVALLRPSKEEREQRSRGGGRTQEGTKLAGYLLLPVTLVIGFDVVAHGHVTPGGGFQGGVVLATAYHLLYVAGSYRALDRARRVDWFEYAESLGAAAFSGIGIAGLAVAGAFLTNVLPFGTFGQLLSAGTVPILNAVVGLEVGAGVVVLLARFLDQAISMAGGGPGAATEAGR